MEIMTTPLDDVATRGRIPWRTIAASIAMLLGTVLLLLVLRAVQTVLTWMLVAAFFAVALAPVVGWVQRRVTGGRRTLATLLVFLLVTIVLGGVISIFVVPLAREGPAFADQLPDIVADARAGRGPIGDLLERVNALHWVQDNQERIRDFVSGLTTPATGVLRGVATGVAGAITIFVLAYLMVLEGPKIVSGGLALLPEERRERVQRVSSDCARSVTGYLSGNLLISIICGVATYVVLLLLGVPFAELIALFVALVDMIPLVGATVGALVAAAVAAVHSTTALVVVVIFFVVYQQLENHVLQPLVLSRTVKLNPLTVLISILFAVELAGILGAFLAIPVAGIVQVIARDVWDHRRGRPKERLTVGEEHEPAD